MDDTVASSRTTTVQADDAAEAESSTRSPEGEPSLLFGEFYRVRMPGLVAFVAWLGADVHLAADIAQEAMLRAYRSWGQITYPKKWVRVVASREYCRRIAAIHAEPMAEFPELLDVTSDETGLFGQQQAEVLALLRRLPGRQRQVMAWTYDGYGPTEIAAALGISANTVRVNLHKARQTLGQYLMREGEH